MPKARSPCERRNVRRIFDHLQERAIVLIELGCFGRAAFSPANAVEDKVSRFRLAIERSLGVFQQHRL
jgi:hypothetical protein